MVFILPMRRAASVSPFAGALRAKLRKVFWLFAAVLTFATPSFSAKARSLEDLTFPGWIWGEAKFPSSVYEDSQDNPTGTVIFHQGVGDFELFQGVTARPYAELELAVDMQRFGFNNYVNIGVGAEVEFQPIERVYFTIGAEYEWEFAYRTDESFQVPFAYAKWFAYRSAEIHEDLFEFGPVEATFETWGELRFPAGPEPYRRERPKLDGYVELGIDWPRIGSYGVLGGFAEFGYTFEPGNDVDTSSISRGTGARIKFFPFDSGVVEFGLKYEHETLLDSRFTADSAIGYVNWYYGY